MSVTHCRKMGVENLRRRLIKELREEASFN